MHRFFYSILFTVYWNIFSLHFILSAVVVNFTSGINKSTLLFYNTKKKKKGSISSLGFRGLNLIGTGASGQEYQLYGLVYSTGLH